MRTEHTHGTRRGFIQSTGVVGLLGLAGCSATDDDDGDGDQSDDQTDADGMVDRDLVTQEDAPPADLQWNEYNPTNYGLQISLAVFDPVAKYDPVNAEFVPYVFEDWSIEEESVTIELSEDFTWHNGEPVTADDVVTQLRLGKFFDYPTWDYASKVEAEGDYTVKISLQGPTNTQVLKHTVLSGRLKQPHSVYGEKLADLRDASDEDEENQLLQELTDWRLEEPVGSGPFKFASADAEEATLEHFEDHPVAGEINFPRIRYKNIPSSEGRIAALETGEIDFDATVTVSPEVKEGFPDHLMEILRPAYAGGGLMFQHDHDVFGIREVRQAFAHVVDRDQVAGNAGPSLKVPVDVISGVSGIPFDHPRNVLGDVLDEFDPYEVDHEKAGSLLEEAGFQQDGGTWKKPDGDTLSVSITVPSAYSTWITGAQTLVGQLNEFGIEANTESVETTAFWGKIWPNGDYDLAIHRWGGYTPYPYFSFRDLYASSASKKGFNFPAEVSVPMPIGDATGSQETVNVEERVTELARTADPDAATDIVTELAWVTNQTLPTLPFMETFGHSWITTDDWETPAADDAVLRARYPPYWPIRLGKFKAKPE